MLSEYSTSFTAHKGALNDALKMWMTERGIFCRNVDKPVNLELLKIYFKRGDFKDLNLDLDLNDYQTRELLLEGKWLGAVPGHINPMVEVNAQIAAEQAGYVLKSDNAALYGTDFEDSIDQWEYEQDRFLSASPEIKAQQILKEEESRANEDID